MFWHKAPEVAFGFLLEMIRPAQSAVAWCMGHGDCKKSEAAMHEDMDLMPILPSEENEWIPAWSQLPKEVGSSQDLLLKALPEELLETDGTKNHPEQALWSLM